MLKEVIYLLRVGNKTFYPGTRRRAVPAPRVSLLPGSPLLSWVSSHSHRVTLSPDMPVMRTSSADLTMLLRSPPKTSFLFFSRTLS